MKRGKAPEQLLHILLRPGFGLALLAAQFLSSRDSLFSQSVPLLAAGGVCLLGSVALWIAATIHCTEATEANEIASTGPYAAIRHPIYASVLLLGLGLGLVFFSWIHLAVVAASVPLWLLESKSEEGAMTEKHGQLYDAYRRGKAMLIPGIL